MDLSSDTVIHSARISPDEQHRYWLGRSYDQPAEGTSVWCMLNPSTADHTQDDATIRTIKGFSNVWGAGAFAVVNLFSYRATEPRDLVKEYLECGSRALIGPQWEEYVDNALSLCRENNIPLTCAWGAYDPLPLREIKRAQIQRVMGMALRHRVRLQCIGVSKDGSPFHPLYHSPAKHLRQPWPVQAYEAGEMEYPNALTVTRGEYQYRLDARLRGEPCCPSSGPMTATCILPPGHEGSLHEGMGVHAWGSTYVRWKDEHVSVD